MRGEMCADVFINNLVGVNGFEMALDVPADFGQQGSHRAQTGS